MLIFSVSGCQELYTISQIQKKQLLTEIGSTFPTTSLKRHWKVILSNSLVGLKARTLILSPL